MILLKTLIVKLNEEKNFFIYMRSNYRIFLRRLNSRRTFFNLPKVHCIVITFKCLA